MVDLAQDTNLIEDLVSAFGVSELSTLDSHDGAIVENALVHFAVAANAKKTVAGEVIGGFLDLSASEKLGGSAPASGIQNSFTLSGYALLCFFYAFVAFEEQNGNGGKDECSSNPAC